MANLVIQCKKQHKEGKKVYRFMKEVFQAVIVMMLINFPCSAGVERTSVMRYYEEPNALVVISELTDGSADRIINFYVKTPFKTLIITSPGGSVDAGLKLGSLVKENGIQVIVVKYCNSACSLVYFSSPKDKRLMEDDSVLGLHNVSIESKGGDGDNTYVTIRQLKQFTEELSSKVGFMFTLYASNGIPTNVLMRIATARGDDVIVVTKKELEVWEASIPD